MILPLQDRRRIAAVVRAFALGAVIVDKRWGDHWFSYARDPSETITYGAPPEQSEVLH